MRTLTKASATITRRQLLQSGALTGMGAALAACAPKIVKETVEVEKEVTKVVSQEVVVTPTAEPPKPVTLALQRFFGECSEEYQGVTDPTQGRGECGIIQVITNQWNAEHPEAQVETTHVEWEDHNARLAAAFAAGDPPDIAVFYWAQIPPYLDRGLLLAMDDYFAKVGIDVNDFMPAPRDWATKDGKIHGLPWDIVLDNLWHINVDLCQEVGLVDDQGEPLVPRNREELLAYAEQTKAKTGKHYIAGQIVNGDICTEWLLWSLMKQQGSELFTEDLSKALVDVPEAHNAVNFMLDLFDKGYMKNDTNYGVAQEMWLNGEAPMHITGSWTVDWFDQQIEVGESAFKRYKVVPLPTIFDKPASYASGHCWVLLNPIGRSPDANRVDAAANFLRHYYDNNLQWARTGHFPARKSVLESAEFQALPHRVDYADAAPYVFGLPKITEAAAFEAIIKEEVQGIYLYQKTPEQGLADAQKRVDEFLAMARR